MGLDGPRRCVGASQDSSKARRFLGALDAHRVTFSTGRDIVLTPRRRGGHSITSRTPMLRPTGGRLRSAPWNSFLMRVNFRRRGRYFRKVIFCPRPFVDTRSLFVRRGVRVGPFRLVRASGGADAATDQRKGANLELELSRAKGPRTQRPTGREILARRVTAEEEIGAEWDCG